MVLSRKQPAAGSSVEADPDGVTRHRDATPLTALESDRLGTTRQERGCQIGAQISPAQSGNLQPGLPDWAGEICARSGNPVREAPHAAHRGQLRRQPRSVRALRGRHAAGLRGGRLAGGRRLSRPSGVLFEQGSTPFFLKGGKPRVDFERVG